MRKKSHHHHQFLTTAVVCSIMGLLPFGSSYAQIGISSGGTIDDKLNISISNTTEDNSGIEYSNYSSSQNEVLHIKNGATINVSAKGNAYGIWGTDSKKTPSFITIDGDELKITATNGSINNFKTTSGGYGAIGIWSGTTWNPVNSDDRNQPTYQGGQITINTEKSTLDINAQRNAFGILAGSAFDNNSNVGGYVQVNGDLDITIKGGTDVVSSGGHLYQKKGYPYHNLGILAYGGTVDLNGKTINIDMDTQTINYSGTTAALYTGKSGIINTSKDTTLNILVKNPYNARAIENGYYDALLEGTNYTPSTMNLDGTTNIIVSDAQYSYVISSNIRATLNAHTLKIDFIDNTKNKTNNAVWASDEGKIYVDNLFIGTEANYLQNPNKITALSTQKRLFGDASFPTIGLKPEIHVNQNEEGTVQLNGSINNRRNGFIDLHLSNADSYLYGNIITKIILNATTDTTVAGDTTNLNVKNNALWKNIDDSDLTNLVLDNKALLDMTHNEYSTDTFQNITIANNMSGTNATINMDIDAGTNVNNSDRLYIAGTHTGEHYITLNNINANSKIDGANGTVLVSVNNEQGKFFANDHEGSLYWKRYILDNKKSETAGYNTDWYLKEVQVIPATPITPANPLPPLTPLEPAKPRPTTSVYAVNTCMELGFDSWIEDNKLMQRMGDLRQKTGNDAGVWVRSKGGKFHNDDYQNSYTAYQLGYDSIVKRTDEFTRYQGVAFAYNDGHSNFNRGSGKNKAKSIAFYSTDMRSKGHYLDLGFKIYNADTDFIVYDTLGKKITGSYDNTGISLSAEYGRKKHLDDRWSIEPQAQLTLGFLGGANYTTSNGIHVSQSDATTALGRIGCNLVYDMDKKTNIYFKANWLHQFAGNYGASLSNGSESLRIDNHEHSTWLEYGLGIACLAGKDKHFYADIERSSSGSVKEDWQWNVGMIWSF